VLISRHPQVLRFVIWFIAIVQVVLGAGFLLAPVGMAQVLGLPPAPPWANWLFGMLAARCLGYAWGLMLAARDAAAHLSWLRTMLMVQAIDWLVTIHHLAGGSVTLSQVTTAPFLPVVFVALLVWAWPRHRAAQLTHLGQP
jgi:hypothetical protein